MLKQFLIQNEISIYSLSKKTDIPYSTLNDLCNGKVEIDNCKVIMLMKLANALKISTDDLYEMCKRKDNSFIIKQNNTQATIKAKNKKYYVEYKDKNDTVIIDLFKVNGTNSKYVKDAAQWLVEEKMIDTEMEDLYALQLDEKR